MSTHIDSSMKNNIIYPLKAGDDIDFSQYELDLKVKLFWNLFDSTGEIISELQRQLQEGCSYDTQTTKIFF